MKKLFIVTIAVIAAVALLAVYATYHFRVVVYRGDFERLLKGSDARVEAVACKQVGWSRVLACYFSSDRASLDKIIKHLEMKPGADVSRGRRLFTESGNDSCHFGQRTQRGDVWFQSAWDTPRKGTHATTYSNASIIYNHNAQDICLLLDIASG